MSAEWGGVRSARTPLSAPPPTSVCCYMQHLNIILNILESKAVTTVSLLVGTNSPKWWGTNVILGGTQCEKLVTTRVLHYFSEIQEIIL